MEAGDLLLLVGPISSPPRSRRLLRRLPSPFPSSPPLRAFSSAARPPSASSFSHVAGGGPERRRDLVREWVSGNDGLVRRLPIVVGGLALLAVLVNRAVSGIAPVADASSSQSRADILTLALAVTDLLTGLVWLSIQPKYVSPVVPRGVECKRINANISHHVILELLWAWESLTTSTCCRSLVIVHGGECLLHIGMAAESPEEVGDAVSVDVHQLIQGSFYRSVMESGKQGYLANLSLYPGRSELPFLPDNTQAVILQPLGDRGIAIIGGDTIRGFTNVDQAWITLIAEKLDATLSKS